jgi:hypothetical protein
MKDLIINMISKMLGQTLVGYKTYLVGFACILVGIVLCVGKLMLPEQFSWLNWVEHISPWFAFGSYCITQAAKGNRQINETQKVSDLVLNLFTEVQSHKEELTTIKDSITKVPDPLKSQTEPSKESQLNSQITTKPGPYGQVN